MRDVFISQSGPVPGGPSSLLGSPGRPGPARGISHGDHVPVSARGIGHLADGAHGQAEGCKMAVEGIFHGFSAHPRRRHDSGVKAIYEGLRVWANGCHVAGACRLGSMQV